MISEVRKVIKNTFGIYVYSKLKYILPFLLGHEAGLTLSVLYITNFEVTVTLHYRLSYEMCTSIIVKLC
jgi:hypothetical protein